MKRLIGALIAVLILLLYVGYFFVADDQNSPFADTVLFVMALVGLLVTLASIGIWTVLKRILREDIEREITRVEKDTRNEALSRMAVKVATAFWVFYEKTKDKMFRDRAISIVEDARKILEGREEVKGEETKCLIYNNLAFAYAERGEAKDTTIAHFLADYVKEKIKDFPEYEVMWLETYTYVLYRLPKKRDDKKKALDIVNELLERADISDDIREEYKQRYPTD